MATSILKAQSAASFPDARRQVNACRGCFAFNVELQPVEDNVAKLFAFMQGGKYVEVDRTMLVRVCEECQQFLRTVNYFMLYCRRVQRTMNVLLKRKIMPCDRYLKCLFDELLRLHPITDTDNINLDISKAILDIEATIFWFHHRSSKETQIVADDIKEDYDTVTTEDHTQIREFNIEPYNQDQEESKSIYNPVISDLNCADQISHPVEQDEPEDMEYFHDTSDITDEIKIESSYDADKDEVVNQIKDQTPFKEGSNKRDVKTVKIKKTAPKLINLKKSINRVRKKDRKKDNVKVIEPRIDPTKTEVIMFSFDEQKAEMETRKDIGHYKCSPYKCELCYKSFTGPKTQSEHMKLHDENAGKFECPLCHRRFEKESIHRRHVLNTHARRFQCLLCDHIARSSTTMKTHQDTHSDKSYQCPDCGLTFRFPSSYYSHIRIKHPTDTVCDVCGEGFLSKAGLRLHQHRSHGIKVPRKRQVYTSGTLAKLSAKELEVEKAHLERQMAATDVKGDGLSKWRCDDCKITFVTLESFQTHLVRSKNHGSQLKNICVVCKAIFPSNDLCEKHLRTHIVKTKTPQDYCRAVLTNHKFRCKACGRMFKSQLLMSEHECADEPGAPLSCLACHKEFSTKIQYRNHYYNCTWRKGNRGTKLIEKKYSCEFCDKRFSKAHLAIHMRSHTGVKPYQCDVCSKLFSLKANLQRHMVMHTGEKPYQCQQCGKRFTQNCSVQLHVRTVHMKMKVPRRDRKRKNQKSEKQTELSADLTDREANTAIS